MPSLRHLSVVLAVALCAPLSAHAIEFSAEELARAKALQQRLVTLDSHLDTPANFGRTGFDIEQRHDRNALSQVDYPRMVEGALDGGFWAIYTDQGDRSAAAHLAERDHGLQRLLEIREMLAANPARFALASYLLELLGRLAPEGGAPVDLKRLFEFALAALRAVDAATPDAKLRAFLELRALHALGLCPELARCVRCGRALAGEGRVGFHVGEGGPLCAACGAGVEGVLPIHLGTLRSLERGLRLDLDRLGRLALGPATLSEARELLARFQRFHLGLELRSQRFLDGILSGATPPAA